MSTSNVVEALIVVGILALIFFILEALNIAINGIYIIIPFIFIWIILKAVFSKKT